MITAGISIEAYHADESLSKSKLMDLEKYGPAHFYAAHIAKTLIRDTTPALRFGKLFDDLTDNADAARARWAPPLPDDAPNRPSSRQRTAKKPSPETVTAIAWWDAWEREHAGKVSVGNDERLILQAMLDTMQANPFARTLWEPCERQVTIRRHLDDLGVSLQSRPDGLNLLNSQPYLADIKTCHDLNRFPSDCITYGYHLQLAIGQWLLAKEGIEADALLIVVESKIAGRCKVYRLPEVALSAGWARCKALVQEIADRRASGDWQDRQEAVETLQLANWQECKLEEIAGGIG